LLVIALFDGSNITEIQQKGHHGRADTIYDCHKYDPIFTV